MASQVITLWGPSGSPGRTTVALSVACELAMAGRSVLFLDLDTYAPSVADFLGLLDHPPGVSAAARLVGQGRLDIDQINRLAVGFDTSHGRLAILTGLSVASRWSELSGERVEGILAVARAHFDHVVVDVAASLESSLRQVGGAIDRNAATRVAIQEADCAIAVFACDPIGVRRLCNSLGDFEALTENPILLANQLRASVLGPKAKEQVEDTIFQLCGRAVDAFIPADREVCDRALMSMTPVALSRRSSLARRSIAQFVEDMLLNRTSGKRG